MPKILNLIFSLTIFLGSLVIDKSPGKFLIFGLVMVALLTLLNYFRVKKVRQGAEDYWHLVLPSLFLLGFFGTMAAISSLVLKLAVAFIGSGLFYFYELNFPSTHPILDEETFTLTAAMLLLISLWAANFFYRPAWWLVSFLSLPLFFLLWNQFFYKIGAAPRTLWAVLLTLLMVELGQAMLYWPANFLTSATAMFAAFYLIYVFTNLYYAHRLTKKRIYFHAAVILILVLGSLMSSTWKP